MLVVNGQNNTVVNGQNNTVVNGQNNTVVNQKGDTYTVQSKLFSHTISNMFRPIDHH